MLRRTLIALHDAHGTLKTPTDWSRVITRRKKLEARRIGDSQWSLPPIEPSPQQARSLYREMLREGYNTITLTDKQYYKKKLREEFEVTARLTSARVRGMMYEKGKWMLKNNLGGIM